MNDLTQMMCAMRFSILAAILLASAVSAQPSAADSVLVERAIDALGYANSVGGSAVTSANDETADVASSTALAASVRAAFLENVDSELIADALVVLEGDAYYRVEQATRDWMSENVSSPSDAIRTLGGDLEGPQADSALVAHYIAAKLNATQPRDIRIEIMTATYESLPDSTQDTLDTLGLWDQMTGPVATAREQALQTQFARVSRYQLATVPRDDLEAMTAFYRSNAGLYVGRTTARGLYQASLPRMIQMMAQVVRR